MDTSATAPAPAAATASAASQPVAEQPAKSWDDYFPVINKAIMTGILVLAVVFVTGVDVTNLAGFLKKRDGGTPIVSSSSMAAVSNFNISKLSVTGPGGWKIIVGLIVALASAAGVVFAVLSSSGLDAAWTKEQQAKHKEKEKPKKVAAAAKDDDGECNLASYKMFFAPKEEPAPSTEAAAPATSA